MKPVALLLVLQDKLNSSNRSSQSIGLKSIIQNSQQEPKEITPKNERQLLLVYCVGADVCFQLLVAGEEVVEPSFVHKNAFTSNQLENDPGYSNLKIQENFTDTTSSEHHAVVTRGVKYLLYYSHSVF